MAEREPDETKNLDGYGFPPLPWSRPHGLLAAGPADARSTFFLATTRPNGHAHSAGVGVRWHDGDLYFNSGPGTRKTKNLETDPGCVLSASLPGLDLVLEGEATKVEDVELMETVAAKFREVGWPVEVEEGRLTAPFSAPSAGPPPWDFYRFTFHTVTGVATAEPYGATRWRFR